VPQVSRFSRFAFPLDSLRSFAENDLRFSIQCGITVILMRFHFDERKSGRLRANPKRGIGFEEVQEVFSHPYYLDQRSDWPEQYRAVGWVGEHLYAVIFEVREDEEGRMLPPRDALESHPAGAATL
jgi:uncharacterized DUF497 family protein